MRSTRGRDRQGGFSRFTEISISCTSLKGSGLGRSPGTAPGPNTTAMGTTSCTCTGAASARAPQPPGPPTPGPARRSPAAGRAHRCRRRAGRRGTSRSFSTTAAAPAPRRWSRRTGRRAGHAPALRGQRSAPARLPGDRARGSGGQRTNTEHASPPVPASSAAIAAAATIFTSRPSRGGVPCAQPSQSELTISKVANRRGVRRSAEQTGGQRNQSECAEAVRRRALTSTSAAQGPVASPPSRAPGQHRGPGPGHGEGTGAPHPPHGSEAEPTHPLPSSRSVTIRAG